MPARENAPLGSPIWVDLMSSDVERARAFYGELFGWDCAEPNEEFGGYANFTKDGDLMGGISPTMEEAMPDVWSIYLEVADAEATVKAAADRGMAVIAPAMALMDLGSMAVVTDPGGAAIGMWQPGTHTGFGRWMEDGTPGWFELHTRAYDEVLPFYREVFGWETRTEGDEPDFRYTTEAQGEVTYAGVMDASGFLPEGVPSNWSVYFHVDDCDAAIAKLVELGGTVVMPAEDTPYGRLATVTDPMGAMFRLHQ
jgi:predicted enzyme related to lactoylglutathione lyase